MNPSGREVLRLFFALWPEPPTRRTLKRATRMAVRQSGGRPVAPANYHLTLAFLGSAARGQLDDIEAAAGGVRVPEFNLCLDRFGYWPRSRVFWLGPARCPPCLAALERALWHALDGLGFRRAPRPYLPHLTLCRKVRAEPVVPLPKAVRWPVKDIALVSSETAAAGARYSVIARFPAGSRSDP